MKILVGLLLAAVLSLASTSAHGTDRSEQTEQASWNVTTIDALKRSLLLGYDKYARPSNHKEPTNVTIGLTVNHLDLDDATGIMSVHSWINLAWTDTKLKWNASDYEGLHELHIADHEIWQPDVVHYLSASSTAFDHLGNTNCIAFENGAVIWVPPAKFMAFCDMDLTHWPHDEHTCKFIFGSWTYAKRQMDLHIGDSSSQDDAEYMRNGEWELIEITKERNEKKYPCCGDDIYVSVTFNIVVKRRGSEGIRGFLIYAPVIIAAMLVLLAHSLPIRSSFIPRLPLAAAPCVILGLSLLYFSQRLPTTDKLPNIVMLYCVSFYMVCVSGMISIIVMNMNTTRKALPWAIRKALSSGVARCLRLPKIADHSTAEELQGSVGGIGAGSAVEEGTTIISGSPPPAKDWLALATAIDRITFIIMLLGFIILPIVYGI